MAAATGAMTHFKRSAPPPLPPRPAARRNEQERRREEQPAPPEIVVIPPPPEVEQAPEQPEGPAPPECAFCYSSEVTRATGRLFRPCPCSTVHAKCLAQWRSRAFNTARCPTCKTAYRLRRRLWLRILSHPVTIGVASTGASVAFVVAPYFLIEGLTRLALRTPQLRPAPVRWWSPADRQRHLEYTERVRSTIFQGVFVANCVATFVLVERALRHADHLLHRVPFWPFVLLDVGLPLLGPRVEQRHGAAAAGGLRLLASFLFALPSVHVLLGGAIRRRIAKSAEHVMDISE